ncbi:MAG: hypothetical protein U0271_07065 [Polyangiaceae bacterium]
MGSQFGKEGVFRLLEADGPANPQLAVTNIRESVEDERRRFATLVEPANGHVVARMTDRRRGQAKLGQHGRETFE